MTLAELRAAYHRRICEEIIRVTSDQKKGCDYPNFADGSSVSSRAIAWGIVRRLIYERNDATLGGQTAGGRFEAITAAFLEQAFTLLEHVRPGQWYYSTHTSITEFDQYAHLATFKKIVEQNSELASSLGSDYIITPDIVVARWPVADSEINQQEPLVDPSIPVATLTPLRQANAAEPRKLLHASISCKWTIRSDRVQNARTEALNLIRNRKGSAPHIVAVTAEPLPMRIASLALGTGDLDCVYHFALYELQAAIEELQNEDQADMLQMLVSGRRLRDTSDLPFDLAI
jgi:hypothetical protein